jgi:hypothetical protein
LRAGPAGLDLPAGGQRGQGIGEGSRERYVPAQAGDRKQAPQLGASGYDVQAAAAGGGPAGHRRPGMLVAERPAGTFTRQVFLGDTLDADHVEADYTAGVLTLSIPVHESAKPRKLSITTQDARQLSPA